MIGRMDELKLLGDLRQTSHGVSAVIGGPIGVGKSRLAHAALADGARDGWATVAIRGSAGSAGVPLGPFRSVLRIPGSSELSELSKSVAAELAAMRSAQGLLVLVDDGQDLDEASSGLLHQLVAAGLIVAIITTRSGVRAPAGLTSLWKDRLAERVELQNLSRRETAELLAAGLGGSVEDTSASRMWHVTGGNPLYLREVVLSSAETGALKQVDGEWQWRGEWAKGARLQEIVAARLGRLDPDELTAMEMLALAGSLPLELVTGLTTALAVEDLEARALVATERSGRRFEVSIAHPVHAEVLRSQMPALRQQSIRRNLADALRATGARRTGDRVRLACWSPESGLDVDLMTLALGSDASLFAIGHAISARLNEILPEAAVELPAGGPAVGEDLELAIRLAQAAYDRTSGLIEGVSLASTLAWTGAIADAETVLAGLAGKEEATDDRLRVALALGWVRFWGRYDVDQARDALTEAANAAGEGCDPVLLATVYEQLAGIALNTAQPATALAYAEQAAAAQGVELSQSVAAPPAAASLSYLGRCGEAIALVDRAVPAAYERGHLLAVATLLFTRAGALARMGELEQARELAEWLRDVALSGGHLDSTANFGVLLGEILLRQGRPATAARIFRDCTGLFAERDTFGYRPWALSGLARARARCGENEAAAVALGEARRLQPIGRHFDLSGYLAEIEVHRLAGRSAAAVEAASQAVDWARAAGMIVDEAQAMDAWLRVAPSSALAERLAELAGLTDSTLVAVLADHARALVEADPECLLDVSRRFAAMTAWWMATEAAAAAARIFEQRHQARAATAAARAAASLAERCEGTPPSAAGGTAGPIRLTKREREIATLAAAGRSSKEIAEEMYLSARTVDNHLYRVYVKLGVTDRTGLAAALAAPGPD
jgi:DNA-binding NarL/FixJ family response regulator